MRHDPHILIVNVGSASLKAALFTLGQPRRRTLDLRIEGIGRVSGAQLKVRSADGEETSSPVAAGGQASAIETLLNWIETEPRASHLVAAGHRFVHGGMMFSDPCLITPGVCERLRGLLELDPEHLPFALAVVEALMRRWPSMKQVACFDTAFHQGLPPVARILALPRRLRAAGVRRYGFHGLSYTHALAEIERLAGPRAASGRLVLAHLGGGASLAAVNGRRCIDTTMSLTPASGVPMGRRSGDIDPGTIAFLAHHEGLDVERIGELLRTESGLLGISGLSDDMRTLLDREGGDDGAAQAVDVFCYEVRKRIGAFAAVLGGLDGLAFTGGVGENAPAVRRRICEGLEFLGVNVDEVANDANAAVISRPRAAVTVRVIPADEERIIAEATERLCLLAPHEATAT